MNIANRINRCLHDSILLRRLTHKTEMVKAAGGTFEVVYEELANGLAVSDPGREISRAEVLQTGPKVQHLQPGETVVLERKLAGCEWHDHGDFRDYVLTHANDMKTPDLLFAYEVIPYQPAEA